MFPILPLIKSVFWGCLLLRSTECRRRRCNVILGENNPNGCAFQNLLFAQK